jgi:hypothetical protein
VWSAPRPGRFTPAKDPLPIVQEAGWAPRPVWTCTKNLTPTGIFFFSYLMLHCSGIGLSMFFLYRTSLFLDFKGRLVGVITNRY